jgi:hypothetical protein
MRWCTLRPSIYSSEIPRSPCPCAISTLSCNRKAVALVFACAVAIAERHRRREANWEAPIGRALYHRPPQSCQGRSDSSSRAFRLAAAEMCLDVGCDCTAPLAWHWLFPVIFQQAEKLASDQPAGSRGFREVIGRHHAPPWLGTSEGAI